MHTKFHQVLHAQAIPYIVDLIHLQNGNVLDVHRHLLCSSSDLTLLSIPRSKRTGGDRAFAVVPRYLQAKINGNVGCVKMTSQDISVPTALLTLFDLFSWLVIKLLLFICFTPFVNFALMCY